MKRLVEKIRQRLCIHWFDPPTLYEFGEYTGAIVCCQQKSWTVTAESRNCSKCGYTESRRVGEPVYNGWD